MSTQIRNLDALRIGTVEFRFAEGATTPAEAAAQGFRDLGNIKEMDFDNDNEEVEHKGSYRGVKQTDRSALTETEVSYKLTVDQLDVFTTRLLSYGVEDGTHTQPSYTAQSSDALTFATTPSTKDRWYNITVSDARVYNIDLVSDVHDGTSSLVEGGDYMVDMKNGSIRFLTAQTTDVTVTFSAAAITSGSVGSMTKINPLQSGKIRGIGELICYDKNSDNLVVLRHLAFGCELSMDDAGKMDGESFWEGTLLVKVVPPFSHMEIAN